MSASRPGLLALARVLLVRVVVPLYVLAGAISKLLFATGSDLPPFMQELMLRAAYGEGPGLLRAVDSLDLLHLIIAVELLAVGAMFFLRRFAFLAALLILGVFLAVLAADVAFAARTVGFADALVEGSCGCFGPGANVPPITMILIDGVLFLGVLVLGPPARATTRDDDRDDLAPDPAQTPARSPVATLPHVVFLLWIAVGLALAFNSPLRPPVTDQGERVELREGEWRPNDWVGLRFEETPLAGYVTVDPLMLGGGTQHWILYRRSCPVCHNLFETEYAAALPEGVDAVVAVHVPPPPDAPAVGESEEVDCPDCHFEELPPGVDWIIPTPFTVVVEEGEVTRVINHLLEGQPKIQRRGDRD